MIVQIYEIQTPSEADSMIALGVDHIGSVILSDSDWKDRFIFDTVRLTQSSGRCSSIIPLFKTFEIPDLLIKVLEYYRPNIVHLCDSLTNAIGIRQTCRKMVALQTVIKKEYPHISIMRSIPIAPSGFTHKVPSIELAQKFESVSDYFLTDTLLVNKITNTASTAVEQPEEGFIGITGRTCDWGMARHLVETINIPVILAGGITPDNVVDGLSQVKPAGVDSCTGTNGMDDSGKPIRFKKDPDKVKKLMKAVRRFNA